MQLFKIDEAIETLLNDPKIMDPETGELLDEEELNELSDEKERVVLYLARKALDELGEAERVKRHVDRLAKRVKIHENAAKSLKKYIAGWCAKGDKFKDDTVKVRIGETVSVDVIDEKKVPAAYMIQPALPLPTVDKKTALADLKLGKKIAGVEIKKGRHTVIS